MDRTERFYRIEHLLQERKVVPLPVFLRELEVSLATFKRDLEYLRDRLQAPIVWDRDAGGNRFEQRDAKFQLPGLWFSAAEIHALLTMQYLLTSLGPDLLTPHVAPLLGRLRLLLESEHIPADMFEQRIRIQRLNARATEPAHFTPIVTAVLHRKCLVIEHDNKFRNETHTREVSPQRLNYYQENGYLDAWCHLRHDMRRFALDAIISVQTSHTIAIDVPVQTLQDTLDRGYGIFSVSGQDVEWAELAFSGERTLGQQGNLASRPDKLGRRRRHQPFARTLCRHARVFHGHPAPRTRSARHRARVAALLRTRALGGSPATV